MRITFISPPGSMGGGTRVIAVYAEQLRRRGHKVLVVSPRPRRPRLREAARALVRRREWLVGRLRPTHFDRLGADHLQVPHGPVTDSQLPDADVAIATWWLTVEWLEALSPAKGAKVHFVQGHEIHGGPRERVEAAYRQPIPKIVISNWLAEIVRSEYGQVPLALVPNSVDPREFHAPPRGPRPVPTVGLMYSPMPIKGTDLCLEAFRRASLEMPELRLVAMGNVPVSRSLPLPPGAEFVRCARGRVLRDIYARCDAWLFGSRMEGFGLPILEAMACRTPVIATPAGAAPELLSGGGGVLVPAEDPRAMARAILRVCSLSPLRWRRLSDAALTTAASYSWEGAAERFEKALEHALQRAAPAPADAAAAGRR